MDNELILLTEEQRVYYTKVVCILIRKIKAANIQQTEKDYLQSTLLTQLARGKFTKDLERRLRDFCEQYC